MSEGVTYFVGDVSGISLARSVQNIYPKPLLNSTELEVGSLVCIVLKRERERERERKVYK